MTVSRALNPKQSNSSETHKRVLEIAEKMGYSRNHLLSSVMKNVRLRHSGSVKTEIAFLHSSSDFDEWKDRDYYRRIFLGAESSAKTLGFKLEPFWLNEPGMSSKRLNDILLSRGFRALLFGRIEANTDVKGFRWEEWAVACLGYTLTNPQMHRACSHQFHNIRLAYSKLYESGHRRIGAVFKKGMDGNQDHAWLAGYWIEEELRLPAKKTPVFRKELTDVELEKWITQNKVDAIISSNEIALGLIQKIGYQVPKDISFISLTNTTSPGIAYIDRNYEEIGASAIDLLTHQLFQGVKGLPIWPKTLLVEGRFYEEKTVAMRAIEGENTSTRKQRNTSWKLSNTIV